MIKPLVTKCFLSGLCVIAACVGVFAQSDEDSLFEVQKIDISGSAAIEGGQIVEGRYAFQKSSPTIENIWIGHLYAGLSARAKLNDNFSVLVSMESRIWYNTSPMFLIPDASSFGAPLQNFDVNVPNAAGILTFGENETPSLTVKLGRFEYKYNPQARDLGEYLFRSGCYPAYIKTAFDLPLARLNGFLVSQNLFNNMLRHDLIINTMTDVRPFLDFNLSYIANLSVSKALEVGGGISFEHLVNVDTNETLNSYSSNGFIKAPGDTAYYTFKGTKLMGRLRFDPKQFFDLPFLGKNDGIIYAEAAILGLKNYPASDSSNLTSNIYGYNNLLEKMPIMFGCNIPTFKLLDVLSIEGEWFGSKYKDSYEGNMSRKPAPTRPMDFEKDEDYLNDNWKWAIFAKKTMFKGLSLIGLVGRDHLRTETYIGQYRDYEATLVLPGQWYWMLKVKSSF
jgi:hypothetical protein